MTRALIKINGSDGSNDDIPINTLVQLDNDGNGGEVTYLWTIIDQPEGTADVLSSSSIHNPTFTPKKEGTYLLKLIVNLALNDESTNTAIVAVRELRTGQRVPAAEETLEDGATGWKLAANRQLQLLGKVRGDSNLTVAWAPGGAVLNQVVKLAGVHTLKAGLPGEEVVPLLALAGAGRPIGVIAGPCQVGGPISNGLVMIRTLGLFENAPTGDPSVGAPVYIDPGTSLPTLSAVGVQIGEVVAHDGGAHTYRFVITLNATAAPPVPLSNSEWFGDGTDGAHHFDGSSVVMGITPGTQDGVTQVYHFITDANFADGTVVDAGVTLWFENCRPYCNGELTNNGHIHNDGRPGVGRLGASNSQTRVYGASNGGGGSGSNGGPGNGGAGSGSGTVIDNWTNQAAAASGANGAGNGQGGGGGSGGTDAGGVSGAIAVAGSDERLNIIIRLNAKSPTGGTVYTTGSGGGGGGVSGVSSGQGGGGGAGGCWLFVGIKKILGTGSITCKGGAGGAPTLVDATGCGGGGGGGGGVLTVVYGSNPGPNTLSAAGGIGHAGVGTGTKGGDGSTGSLFLLNLSGDGT